jgi:hypothetical protein
MQALDWTRDSSTYDGLEPLAPMPAQIALPSARFALTPMVGAAAGGITAILISLFGSFGNVLIATLGGTAALLYLGTAMVSGRRAPALFDFGTAGVAAGLAISATAPAIAPLLVHAVWGILRGTWSGVAPGRRFSAAWAAFFATAALLLGVGA